jgi:hypothetical protein
MVARADPAASSADLHETKTPLSTKMLNHRAFTSLGVEISSDFWYMQKGINLVMPADVSVPLQMPFWFGCEACRSCRV